MRNVPSNATRGSLLYALRTDPGSVAWGQFVDRYKSLIEGWCQAWGLQDADRDDVVQDVLLNLSKAMSHFEYDPSKSFRAWLKTVTKHAVATSVKRAKKQGVGQGGTAILRLVQSVEAERDLTQRLQDQYDTELTELAILRVRMRVKPRTWQAFQSMVMEGKRGAEVAAELGMKVSHVYVAKSEVLTALRQEIVRLEPGNEDHDQGRIEFATSMPD